MQTKITIHNPEHIKPWHADSYSWGTIDMEGDGGDIKIQLFFDKGDKGLDRLIKAAIDLRVALENSEEEE